MKTPSERMENETRRLRQRGSSLVEQALVIVLLLSVMFGIIDFGRALYTYHFVASAAREAARWASVRSSTTNLPGGPANAANIQALVSNVSGMGLDPALVKAVPNWLAAPNGSPACPANKPGCVVQVQVTYNYHFFFPFLPTSLVKMQSTSEMVITQ
jgi:Flp pilus assembly protein TadG